MSPIDCVSAHCGNANAGSCYQHCGLPAFVVKTAGTIAATIRVMDIIFWIKVLILGAVEGFTEFLPISSTGHLIIAGQLLGFNDERGKIFEIVIQTGAMLAIVWEYRVKFAGLMTGITHDRKAQQFVMNLAIAFMPAAILGLAFNKYIKAVLFKPVPVAIAFIVGGIIILWAERRTHTVVVQAVDDMSWKDALKVGCAQAFALIPGTSRSGATIIGGLLFGLSRRAATEFSFFLAVPTLIAAGGYDLFKNRALFDAGDIGMFAVGMTVSFASAFLCVRWLLRYIASHDFTLFAWYRIVFGLLVLLTAYSGVVIW
jgi:undecaprenyl-diphosphatase